MAGCATSGATATQQPPALPDSGSVALATGSATAAQRGQPSACNSGLLTGHRIAATLNASINHCCDLRGDEIANRTALIAEVAGLARHQQADLIEHFDHEAARWAWATGSGTTGEFV